MAYVKCSGGGGFDFSKLRIKMHEAGWYYGYPDSGSNGKLYGIPTVTESLSASLGTISGKGGSKTYTNTDFKKIIYAAILFTWTNQYRYGFTCFGNAWDPSWYYGRSNSMSSEGVCSLKYISDNSFDVINTSNSNVTGAIRMLIGIIN